MGNKNDTPDRKVVLTEDAQRFADTMNIQLFETSAKDNINVEEMFMSITRLVLRWYSCKYFQFLQLSYFRLQVEIRNERATKRPKRRSQFAGKEEIVKEKQVLLAAAYGDDMCERVNACLVYSIQVEYKRMLF